MPDMIKLGSVSDGRTASLSRLAGKLRALTVLLYTLIGNCYHASKLFIDLFFIQ